MENLSVSDYFSILSPSERVGQQNNGDTGTSFSKG